MFIFVGVLVGFGATCVSVGELCGKSRDHFCTLILPALLVVVRLGCMGRRNRYDRRWWRRGRSVHTLLSMLLCAH